MWGKVDDKLHSSVKWRRASRTARGLWTTALSWCSDQENGGQVPADMLRHLDGTKADAASLVKVGLWETTDDGYAFHDWEDHNPDAATAKATRAAKSSGGKEGNHVRWHVKRGIKVAGCEWCEENAREGNVNEVGIGEPNKDGSSRAPSRGKGRRHEQDRHGSADSRSDKRSDTDRGSESEANPPGPDPTRPDNYGTTSSSSRPRSSRAIDEPEPHPQPEMSVNALLAAAGLSRSEHRAFLVDLKANNARDTGAVVNALHRKGELTDRIAKWRRESDLAAEAAARPKAGKPTTSDKVRDGIALAVRLAAEEGNSPSNVTPFPKLIEGA